MRFRLSEFSTFIMRTACPAEGVCGVDEISSYSTAGRVGGHYLPAFGPQPYFACRPSGTIQTLESAGSADIPLITASFGGTKRQNLTTRYQRRQSEASHKADR